MSEMGLGLAAVGRPAYINLGREEDLGDDRSVETLRSRAWAVLDAAWDAGVRYVDAARSYGRAEEFLGGWLSERGLGRSDLFVASKWGYAYTADWKLDASVNELRELTGAQLRRQLAETRALLGDRLSLYQIHSATVESGVFDDSDVMGQLAELRASGVLVGISTTGPRQWATIERAVESGAFDTVQSTWNLLERSVGAALALAHDAGMRVIVKEGVANGRLTPHAAPTELRAAADRLGMTPDAVALAAVLARPYVDVVLSGAVTPSMLASNLLARDVAWSSILEEEVAGLVEPPETYWSERASLAWS